MNIQIKSETSKAKWLMEIATNPDFKIHLETISDLVGVQKGDNKGKDLIFASETFITRTMKIGNPFYKEAMQSLSKFTRKKGINDPVDWDKENIFHNPLILSKTGKTLKETNISRTTKFTNFHNCWKKNPRRLENFPLIEKWSIFQIIYHWIQDQWTRT